MGKGSREGMQLQWHGAAVFAGAVGVFLPVRDPAIYDAAVFSFFPLQHSIVCGFLALCGSSLSLLKVWASVLWPVEGGTAALWTFLEGAQTGRLCVFAVYPS